MAAPAIGRRARWAPGPSAKIDWSHPLAQGLKACLLPVPGGVVDLVTGTFVQGSPNASHVATEAGLALQSTSANSGVRFRQSELGPVGQSFTWVGRRSGAGTNGAGLLCCSIYNGADGEGAPYLWGLDVNGSNVNFVRSNGGSFPGYSSAIAASSPTSGVNVITATLGGDASRGYLNGALTVTDAASTAPALGAGGVSMSLTIGQYTNVSRTANAISNLGLWHWRPLSLAEHQMIYADPFCMLTH